MTIRAWSDEYSSGIEQIDEQHKGLFQRINAFEEENDDTLTMKGAVDFLDGMMGLLEEHFAAEDALMEENDYPLMDVHKAFHNDLRAAILACMDSVKSFRSKSVQRAIPTAVSDREPYRQVLELLTGWLDHIVRDDTIIFHYCEHRDFNLAGAIYGRTCEILTMDNQLLGYGKIDLIENDDIEINYKHGRIPVKFNDVVKVSVIMQNQESCHFVSKVYLNKNSSVKLFRGAVIKTENDRAFYRISVLIDAVLKREGQEPMDIRIIDISAGGLLIATETVMEQGEEVLIQFMLEKTWFTEKCTVMRTFKKDTVIRHYGMKFAFDDGSSLTNLVGQLNTLQGKRNQKL
ncbi:MAG: PilZ domain-containing protein [Clostridiales bacterium]|nr:PilZ domain-containing protein [Clostridiales bacterium]